MNFKVFFTLAALALTLCSCQKEQPPATPPATDAPPPEPTEAQPKLQTMKIYLGAETLETELALTPREEQVGMMFRTNIQETDSMLFVFPFPQRASFWMKNCPESISAAYLSPDGIIREIHHLEKNDVTPVVAASDNIQFVIETKEGWFARHNVNTGAVVITEHGPLVETFLRRH